MDKSELFKMIALVDRCKCEDCQKEKERLEKKLSK